MSAALGDRSLFPTLEPTAYLAHAAVSPPSVAVQHAVAASVSEYAKHGLRAAIRSQLRPRLKQQLAQLVNASPEDLGLLQSTSAGVIAIARSIRFRPGDRIITFEGEFPANVTPWRLVAEEQGLSCVQVPLAPFLRSKEEGLAVLRAELALGARLVAVSFVQFSTGLRMPLAEMAALAHQHGAELFVDAIQGLGAVPLDVQALDLDYLASGAHKFLMGMEGAGVLYVHRRCMEQLSLGLAGWTGHEEAFTFLQGKEGLMRYDRPLLRRASFVEQGALSMISAAALSASLDLLLSLGVEQIFAHVSKYLDALEPALVELGFQSLRAQDEERRSASLCLRVPGPLHAGELAQRLDAQGIAVSTPDGFLRFAPHWPNHLAEVPLVVAAVKQAMR